jgi:hypothetical protein
MQSVKECYLRESEHVYERDCMRNKGTQTKRREGERKVERIAVLIENCPIL